MRASILLALGVAASLAALAGCDDGGRPRVAQVEGRVLAGLEPEPGAVVHLWQLADYYGLLSLDYRDSTVADLRGLYRFTGLEAGTYHATAGVRDASGRLVAVSPLSDALVVAASGGSPRADLSLRDVVCGGTLAGRVVDAAGDPVSEALVAVSRMDGDAWRHVAGTATAADGSYAFGGLCTGTYRISGDLPIVLPDDPVAEGVIQDLWHPGRGTVTAPDLLIDQCVVRKPAIYLYPPRTMRFRVELEPAADVALIASDPPYGDGWQVTAAPDGRLDGRRDYLFYEVATSRQATGGDGWCLAEADLPAALPRLLAALGLQAGEIDDLLAYWRPLLRGRPYWAIRPVVDGGVDAWVRLHVRPAPDSVRRVWLFFRGLDAPVALTAPELPGFARRGIVLVEWGGALAR